MYYFSKKYEFISFNTYKNYILIVDVNSQLDLLAILEYVLQDLFLCKPIYEVISCDNNLFIAHITLHAINLENHILKKVVVIGEQVRLVKEAKYTVALRALEKIQNLYNIDIIDINFYQLQQCKSEKIILANQVEGLAHELDELLDISTYLEKRIVAIKI